MSDATPLPVWPTVVGVWRQFAARPDYMLRVGWIPALLLFGIGAASHFSTGVQPGASFWRVGFALLNFAVLVQALVAWQRYALPERHPRKGLTGLRAGRAEFFSLVHFPLVGILFVPLFVPTMIKGLTEVQDVADGLNNAALGVAGLALLVFPGGLVLIRAALMLPAIAAAGNKPISLVATANRVWELGAGSSIRLLAVFYVTVLPAALALVLLPPELPALAASATTAILLPVYVMLSGGALAVGYGRLNSAPGKAGKSPS
jgi:hypothetical protein